MEDLDHVVMGILIIAAIIGIPTCIYQESKESKARESKCQLEHHGQNYTEETLFAVTRSGCRVMEVQRYNKGCYPDKTLYVTEGANCKGVNWQEYHNKHTTDEATVNE